MSSITYPSHRPAVHLPSNNSWSAIRTRTVPLAQMPHMWQPNHYQHGPYHSSHCDHAQHANTLKSRLKGNVHGIVRDVHKHGVAKRGWSKWSQGAAGSYGDWYANKPTAYEPDWYSRKVGTIQGGNYKYRQWPWDQASKASTRKADGIRTFIQDGWREEVLQPRNQGYHGKPQLIPMEVPAPKWGLHHPHHYEEPLRLNHFPPLHGTANYVGQLKSSFPI